MVHTHWMFDIVYTQMSLSKNHMAAQQSTTTATSLNEQWTSTDISPKNTYKQWTDMWKDVQPY